MGFSLRHSRIAGAIQKSRCESVWRLDGSIWLPGPFAIDGLSLSRGGRFSRRDGAALDAFVLKLILMVQ
jgi:hypothetical protein